MAVLSNKSFLQRSTDGTAWTTVVPITSVPDMGGTPEQIDITTLSDTKIRNMNGLQTSDALEFGAWYDPDTYPTITGYATNDAAANLNSLPYYRVAIGSEQASKGSFVWQGRLSVFVASYEVNAAIPITITISDEGEEELHWVAP